MLSREPMNDGCPDVCNKSVEETKRVQPLKFIEAALRCTGATALVQTTKTSVHGTINMLGLAKRLRARILQASTSEVYGDPSGPG